MNPGELILTEVNRKFRVKQIVPYLSTFALETKRVFTDPRNLFSVLLLKRK